ncbi:hypothetical protein PHMEG_00018485 [Phytophthora megakarya]|uniref:Uncharacterized protein n=1 Tax=Phytophthora megakarya TaxID=4795 RepID=A0A225VWG9_9STRA|nr:hypothetical protein PHMEG_00018485 [Phytophthora megakarya]
MVMDKFTDEERTELTLAQGYAGEAMVLLFRSKRTDKSVMTEICNARKKETEPCGQYANRLKRMASYS